MNVSVTADSTPVGTVAEADRSGVADVDDAIEQQVSRRIDDSEPELAPKSSGVPTEVTIERRGDRSTCEEVLQGTALPRQPHVVGSGVGMRDADRRPMVVEGGPVGGDVLRVAGRRILTSSASKYTGDNGYSMERQGLFVERA